jgi:NAD(P)-dependent dehydrogenase (short-subunit alcohol dehydrogenase family)
MTRICVAGGTGQVGSEVGRQALAQGHAVAVLSRNPPLAGSAGHHDGAAYFRADVTTGEGLPEAMAGAGLVIDCLEGMAGKALKLFGAGGALLRSGARAPNHPACRAAAAWRHGKFPARGQEFGPRRTLRPGDIRGLVGKAAGKFVA